MFKHNKTTAVLVMFTLTVMGTSLWAQPSGRSRPRRRARPQPEAAAPKTPRTPSEDAAVTESTPDRPAQPAPPVKYLEAGAKLFNTGQYELAAKYLDAANRYRDQLQQDERVMLDAYLKELAKVQETAQEALPRLPAEASSSRASNRSAKETKRPEYVVEPPDLILVEVLEAAPGRPISGERLVRPDGRVSLGFYGEVEVAGLSIPEIKEKIVLHLRTYLSDRTLGLVEIDPYTGEPTVDPTTNKIKQIDPRDTDRVFVDVTAYNSSHVYVEGDVLLPRQIPYTGGDTVLDLIHDAGGLLPTCDQTRIRLIRSFPKGSPARVLPVDYQQITMGTDSSTNYAVLPNDRLVVPRDPSVTIDPASARRLTSSGEKLRAKLIPNRLEGSLFYDRGRERSGYFDRQSALMTDDDQNTLEPIISEIEAKLDRLLEATAAIEKETAERASQRPAMTPEELSQLEMDDEELERILPELRQRRQTTPENPRSLPRRLRPRLVRPFPGNRPSAPCAAKRSGTRPTSLRGPSRCRDRPNRPARRFRGSNGHRSICRLRVIHLSRPRSVRHSLMMSQLLPRSSRSALGPDCGPSVHTLGEPFGSARHSRHRPAHPLQWSGPRRWRRIVSGHRRTTETNRSIPAVGG